MDTLDLGFVKSDSGGCLAGALPVRSVNRQPRVLFAQRRLVAVGGKAHAHLLNDRRQLLCIRDFASLTVQNQVGSFNELASRHHMAVFQRLLNGSSGVTPHAERHGMFTMPENLAMGGPDAFCVGFVN